MSKDWIIEVLGDLRGFAVTNGMPSLAEQLEEAVVVAVTELAQTTPRPEAERYDAKVGQLTGPVG
ncbi:MAG: hypothetical protein AAF366_05115 [Pseudomonadota bacterium]